MQVIATSNTDTVTMTTTMMMIMMIISQGMSVRSVGKIYNAMEDVYILYRLLLQDGDLLQRRFFSVCSLRSFCRAPPWQSRGAFLLASIGDGECGDRLRMMMIVMKLVEMMMVIVMAAKKRSFPPYLQW